MIQAIATHGRKYYFPKGAGKDSGWPERPFMPVEFSVAAFRYGHSTVRDSYNVSGKAGESVPLFDTDRNLTGFKKIPDGMHMSWDHFFLEPNGTSRKQSAHKIDPFLPDALFALPFTENKDSLASRNLMRGRIFRLPSGEAIARRMVEDGVMLSATDSMSDDHIAKHTCKSTPPSTKKLMQKLQKEYALNETPLWLYVLIEASIFGDGFVGQPAKTSKGGGDRLGPVGGRIVGEVLMGLLDHYRDATGKGLDYSPPALFVNDGVKLTHTYFGPRMSMRSLINYAYSTK